MCDIQDPKMRFWFVLWIMALFNIAISGPQKTKFIIGLSVIAFAPLMASSVTGELVGNYSNLYNYKHQFYCNCSESQKIFYGGYAYMIAALIGVGIWRIADRKESNRASAFKEWLHEKTKT